MEAGPSARALAELAAAFVRARHGNLHVPVNVVVRLNGDLDLESVAVELTPAAAGPAPDPDSEVIGNVLEALAEADGTLTGAQIAERAGYANSGRFRSVLSRLVREGKVVNERPGYRLPA